MKNPKTALFPGSFDPFTLGHEFIVRRGLTLFDHIIVAIGHNSEKDEGFFPIELRMDWIRQTFKDEKGVEVAKYSGLTIDFCRQCKAGYILRGLRTAADFEYERAIGQMNRAMAAEVETVFLLTAPEHTAINSTIVREVIRHGGDPSPFLPKNIKIPANYY
jgi:pantetheine-phosphate adenylyltransferase